MDDIELHDPDMRACEIGRGYICNERVGVCPVIFEICGDLAIFEGDIILGTLDTMRRMNELVESYADRMDDEAAQKNMIAKGCIIQSTGKWWTKTAIPYEIKGAQNLTAIDAALAYVNKYTTIKMFKHTTETDYVSFVQSTGNSSYVGRQGGEQEIRISDRAQMGNVVHEIFHAAGMWHEQSRADRDKYVDIYLANLKDQKRSHNFDQHISDGMCMGPYDYGSIMHYSRTAFAKPGTQTIVPKDPQAIIGQRVKASEYDKMVLAYMFATT